MGHVQVTVKGLEVLESHPARGLLIIAGSVPGARNGLLKIRFSKQSVEAARDRKPQAVEPEAAVEEEETPVAEAAEAAVEEAPAEEIANEVEAAPEEEAPADEPKEETPS
jgi:large subunit ribosomal protein L3